jgi:23S rRNA pseudouridine1911/1915/1917 synthase
MEVLHFRVDDAGRRKRLDEFLFERIGAVSKMHLRSLILLDKCLVNSSAGKAGDKLQIGDEIEIEVDLSVTTSMSPEPIPLEILFEDDELIIINKPAGMLVHPTRGVKSGTLLNALSYHLNYEQKTQSENNSPVFIRPGLIHRLDRQTSGLMVIAKTNRAHRILSDHFQRKLVEKKYFAVVEGIMSQEFGEINAPIGQSQELKKWLVKETGKTAETRFRVLKRFSDKTLLELEPVTGRTNQLRIHCEFINHPILGDESRGGREFPRLCLHAGKLSFNHPNGIGVKNFETAIPPEFNIDYDEN